MQDEKTGGTEEEQTGSEEGSNAGSGGNELTRRQFLDQVATSQIAAQTPEGGELTPEQQRDIREATREIISNAQDDFEDLIPDGTRSQKQAFAEAILENDPAKIINTVMDAVKVAQEKEEQERREESDDLHVQRGGSGKPGESTAPTSLRGAMAQAARG